MYNFNNSEKIFLNSLLSTYEYPHDNIKKLYMDNSLYELYCYKNNCGCDIIENNKILVQKRMQEINKVVEVLFKNHIPFVILKGPYLAQVAYGSIGLRKFNDIDILIDKNHINKVIDICKKLGFVEGKYIAETNKIQKYTNFQIAAYMLNSHQTPTLVKIIDDQIDVTIDINHSLFWNGYAGTPIKVDNFIMNCRLEKLFEIDNIYIPVLDNEKFLLQLFIHTYKEANGYIYITYNNGLSIKAFLDIYYYLINIKELLDIEKFISMIDQWNLGKIAYFIAYYLDLLFNENIISPKIKYKYSEYMSTVHYFGLDKERKISWENINPFDRFFINDSAIIYNKLTPEEIKLLNYIRETLY